MNKTSRVSTERGNLADYALFVATHKVADLFFHYIQNDPRAGQLGIWMIDRRDERVNPCYHQTACGLLLEIDHNYPHCLWTPWGEYGFAGSGGGCWRAVMDDILEHFHATVYKENAQSSVAIYTIHSVDDQILPEPLELARASYTPYEEARDAWKALNTQYRASK